MKIVLIILSIIIIIIATLYEVSSYIHLEKLDTYAKIGDSFGTINTLFSGIALIGIIYTIILQSKELRLQREELAMTRAELKKSAEAQEEQSKLMLKSAKLNALVAKYQTYANFMINEKIYSDEQFNFNAGDQRKYLAKLEKDIDSAMDI